MGTELQTKEISEEKSMSIMELKQRASMVSQIKSEIMKQDVHWGKIPGCGDKPTLLKNGAELLCMAFGLASTLSVEVHDLGSGHREYTVTTTLSEINTGRAIATGIGCCSTMESKYRYRGNESEPTGKAVPQYYWDAKRNNPGDAQKMLGGKGFRAKKDASGNWMIYKIGDKKIENPDIADTYNTVLKMASKRSLVDATLKATGGSAEFTQDAEDIPFENGTQSNIIPEAEVVATDPPPAPNLAPNHPAKKPAKQHNELTDAEKRTAFAEKMNELYGRHPDEFLVSLGAVGFERIEDVPLEKMSDTMKKVVRAINDSVQTNNQQTNNQQEIEF
jgi:hypothetical protein